ncbi:hypothetical protein ACM66B_004394 [Microbotryomycetes sp. NB124-2]
MRRTARSTSDHVLRTLVVACVVLFASLSSALPTSAIASTAPTPAPYEQHDAQRPQSNLSTTHDASVGRRQDTRWLDHDLTNSQPVYDKIPQTSRVVLIRHAEKRKHSKPGLSKKGLKRAQCLRQVLGRLSKYEFGLIIAQSYNQDTGTRKRPFDTVKPLADDLGLPVHTNCERDDPACVIKLINDFSKQDEDNKGKDVLICWKHSFLHVIARALGSQTKSTYPDDRFDILWVLKNRKIIAKESEHCPKLDKHHRAKNDGIDPDLRVSEDDLHEQEDDDEEEWSLDEIEQLTLGNK